MKARSLTLLGFVLVAATICQAQTTGGTAASVKKAVNPPPRPYQAPSLPSAGTNATLREEPSLPGNVAGYAAGAFAFLHPSIHYSLQYGDAVPSGPGERKKSTIHQLTPSLRAVFAEQWTFSYSPSFVWYSNSAFEKQTNHNVALHGSGRTGDVDIGLNQTYSHSTEALIETGQQTKQEVWGTSISAAKPITDRLVAEASGSQQLRFTDTFTDTRAWNGSGWLRYQYSSSLTLGGGIGGGYTAINPGADFTSRFAKTNLRWTAGPRLSTEITLGADFTKSTADDSSTHSSPAYGVNLRYQIFEPTAVVLTADRSVGTTYFSEQMSDLREVSLRLEQRILGRLQLYLSASRSDADYIQARRTVSTQDRSDKLTVLRASLGARFFDRLPVSISWQHNRNDSNNRVYALRSTTVGLNVGWDF